MNRDSIRLSNVRALIQATGGTSKFARAIGTTRNQVSQFAGRNPTRGIGNIVAERIERAFKKPPGWLDRHDAYKLTVDQISAEGVRRITPREREMFDLFSSLPRSEQDELVRVLEEKKQYYDKRVEELLIEKGQFVAQPTQSKLKK